MASSSANRGYEDFDPPSDMVSEEVSDTLLIYLPGFRKEQLKVQLTPSRVLKISGERPIGGNKWRRFNKEFRVLSNFDTKQISAKFEGGILYIRLPKIITPAAQEAQQQPQNKGKPALQPPKSQPPPPQPAPLPPPSPPPQTQPQPLPLPEPVPEPNKDHTPPKLTNEWEAEKKEGTMARKDEIPQQPQPKKEAQPSDMPRLEEDAKKKAGSELIKRRARQMFRGSGLFRELRTPENMKRAVISAVMVLAIGFYISYIFKSFARDEQ